MTIPMFRNTLIGAVLAVFSVSTLHGDFRYDETAKITGGMMAGMMKVVGVFSKQAREPIKSTVAVQGNRMVRKYADRAEIVDLDADTMTEVNFQKKNYSVVTFAEIRQAMEKALKETKDRPEVTVKGSVKETGQTRDIFGIQAKEAILTFEMESTDPESGKKSSMTVNSDMWLAAKAAGYDEMADFQRRYAEKLNMALGGGLFMNDVRIAKGMSGLAKEAAKLNGMPVLQLISMGFKAEGMPEGGAAQQQAPPPQQEQKAEAPSGGALGGALGGRLGGLGRFGRKKPKEEPRQEQPAPQPEAQQQPASSQQGAGPGALIEMTVEMSNFSNTGVAAADFSVPNGFKKVESERLKRMK